MSLNQDWFQMFKEFDGGIILFRNHKTCKIIGMRSIKVRMFDGYDRALQNVIMYVLELRRNFISLEMLNLLGCFVKIQNRMMKVHYNKNGLWRGQL